MNQNTNDDQFFSIVNIWHYLFYDSESESEEGLKKMIHSRLDFQIKKTFLFLTGFAILIVILFPLAWLLINAIKTNAEAQKIPPEWIPNEFTLEPLLNVILDLDGYATHWGTYFLNTIFVTIPNVPSLPIINCVRL